MSNVIFYDRVARTGLDRLESRSDREQTVAVVCSRSSVILINQAGLIGVANERAPSTNAPGAS